MFFAVAVYNEFSRYECDEATYSKNWFAFPRERYEALKRIIIRR